MATGTDGWTTPGLPDADLVLFALSAGENEAQAARALGQRLGAETLRRCVTLVIAADPGETP